MRKTSVYLSPRLKAALAARAAATGRSEAEVIRAALEAEVRADGPGPGSGGSGLGSGGSGLGADGPGPRSGGAGLGARHHGSASALAIEAPGPRRIVGR